MHGHLPSTLGSRARAGTSQLPELMGSLKVAPLPARSAFSLYGSQHPAQRQELFMRIFACL
jgi:hypothetical protein